VAARDARSVVLVEGDACRLHLRATGFAVASSLVITNAHVVAGEIRTQVVSTDGRRLPAIVVSFDGRHDIALLRVPGARFTPLTLGPTVLGSITTVLGHPGGGSLRATPARVARRIDISRTDIYRTGTITTSIVNLAAHLIVGDSGAPVIGIDRRVQAMVFAIDPSSATSAFALSSDELRPFMSAAAALTKPVSTGPCLRSG